MTAFIEIISFFGVASFFAWLGFAALQGEQLREYTGQDRTRARRHLFTIYDFFLIAFVCYAIAFVADYFLHITTALLVGFETYHSPLLYGIVASFFVLGLLTLALPIAYIRSISKGTATPLTVNPPGFSSTLVRFLFAAWNLLFAAYEYGTILYWEQWFWWDVWRFVWLLVAAVCATGFFLSIRDWDLGRRRTVRNGLMLFLPVISTVVATILHLPF